MQCDIKLGNDTIRLYNNHFQTTSVTGNKQIWEQEFSFDDPVADIDLGMDVVETISPNYVKRAQQVDDIVGMILTSPYPVLACGDFNSIPSSYAYHLFDDILTDGFKTCGRGYMYTYRDFRKLFRIDYIFYSEPFEGTRYYSPSIVLCNSDHKPVLMEMKFNP